MKLNWMILMAALIAGISGCTPGEREARGFRLPDGDRDKGRAAFVDLKCNACHSVSGDPVPAAASPGQHNVALGGEVYKVKTYGQLVTAVIHPAHDIAQGFDKIKVEGSLSPMPEFNQVMTVQQMIDIVTFLHSSYKKRELDYDYPALGY